MRITACSLGEAKADSGGSITILRATPGTALMRSCERSLSGVSLTCRFKALRRRGTVIQPIVSANAHRITNVSSAETPARRTRIGSRSKLAEMRRAARMMASSGLRTKDVAGSPDRVQQARLALGLELAAQVR